MESVVSRLKTAQNLLTTKYKLDLESIYSIRKELHKHPEIGYQEFETRKRLLNFLTTHCNISPEGVRTYATTGFTYDIKGKAAPQGQEHIIAFRADMDALPMKELSTFPHASINPGAAHMCGHDGHMATLLGVADVLSRFSHCIPSNKSIRLLFQPAEEGGHGAEKMVAEGALDGVNEVYGLHSWSIPFGKFGIRKAGAMTSGMVRFRVDIHGKGTHGAYPENGHDPITALCQIHSAIQTILSQGISRKEFAVCTIGEIHGGSAENIIPDFASMGGTIRTEKKKVEEEVKQQLERIVSFIAKGFDCEGKVRYVEQTPAVMNHPEQANAIRQVVQEIMGADSLTEDSMGASEDFSFMAEKVPGAYMLMGHAIPEKEVVMNHNPRFDYCEDLIAPCVLAWVKLVENRLGFQI